jgi:hypothetical protein
MAALAVFTLAACGSKPKTDDDPYDRKPRQIHGLEAPLFPKGGSSAKGSISVYPRGERWVLSVSIVGLPPNTAYRVAFFDNGNCSSPNAFSAGKPWLPPETPEGTRADKWITTMHATMHGTIDSAVRLPNPSRHNEEVFRKRSVLVFIGEHVQELKPDIPNNVVACGVFDTIQSLI